MRLTKCPIPKSNDKPKKKKEKTLTTNFESFKPENIILKKILQKNSSLKNLKEKIQRESSDNIHEIFSTDESRQKAIKYVINASKGKENLKNLVNQNLTQKNNKGIKFRKNLSFVSSDIPLPNESKKRIKVKRSQKALFPRIEQISPIKKQKNINNFINDDIPLNEEFLFKENNILSNNREKKYFDNFPSPIFPRKQSYEIMTQREINLEYLPKKIYRLNNIKNNENKNLYINNTDNNFYENKKINKEITPIIRNNNFYHKINNVKRKFERVVSPQSDYECTNSRINDKKKGNRTLNHFYIHKRINKSGLYENNIGNNTSTNKLSNRQENKIIYSTKNSNYNIIKFNLNDNFVHKKNASQDQYSNIYKKYSNKNSFFKQESNINTGINYISEYSDKKNRYMDNINNKKKNIIRISNAQVIEDLCKNNLYQKNQEKNEIFKNRNNSFYINDIIPININNFDSKDYYYDNNYYNLTPYCGINNYGNDFSFQKKIVNNLNNKSKYINNNNKDKENSLINSNKILVKKRPLKESLNYEISNPSQKISPKNKSNNYNKLFKVYNISFNIQPKIKNKICFDNENDIIEYINNKYKEDKKYTFDKKLKYTGLILSKKYKGKILYEIRIEEDIKKLNQKIKDENIQIGNESIEIITTKQREEYDIYKNNLINLKKEISKLNQENESIIKRESMKNDLIKRLDKEKQKLIEENGKISDEIKQLKKLNEKLNKKLKQIPNNNNNNKYKIENTSKYNIKSVYKIGKFDDKKLKEEKIDFSNTLVSNEYSNNLSLNINNSNGEIVYNLKKNNGLSIFRLSKVSEIKERKSGNIDSGDKEIKNNLSLLNGKSNSNNSNNNNNNNKITEKDINSFNNENCDE